VVVHRNAQWPRDLDDRPRHVDVGTEGWLCKSKPCKLAR
jgi:hypothetical protein